LLRLAVVINQQPAGISHEVQPLIRCFKYCGLLAKT
jgi:hypothetical protein